MYEIGISLFAFMSKWQLKVKIFNIRILPKILYIQETRVILSTYTIGFKGRTESFLWIQHIKFVLVDKKVYAT